MRIIFQNGEIAILNNIHSIVVNNDMERNILIQACSIYDFSQMAKKNLKSGADDLLHKQYENWLKEVDDYIWNSLFPKEDTNEQYPSSTEVCDGSVSEPDMASEGSQHAGQTGIRDIPEEAGRKGTP